MIKKLSSKLLICAILACSFYTSQGQERYFELGGGLGISTYAGDLAPSEAGRILGTSRFSGTAFLRYNLHPNFNLKLAGNYGYLVGRDAWSDNVARQKRNLSFFTDIYEIALTGEVNLFKYAPLNGEGLFTIYLMGGIAGFHFNPKAELEGQVYELQKFGTEGQGLEAYPEKQIYSLYEIAVPFGGGIKFKLSESLNLNFELGWRLTFTDHIDDVSGTYPDYFLILEQRGDIAARLSNRVPEFLGEDLPATSFEGRVRGGPEVDDYYILMNIGLSYNLVGYNSNAGYNGFKARKSKISKCPKF